MSGFDDDLDDALLALAAGGDESAPDNDASQSRSQSPARQHSPQQGRQSRSQSPSKISVRRSPSVDRTMLLKTDDDDHDDGSIPGSPASLGSGAMDESDAESDNEHTVGLTGLEREQRLAELAEQEEERRKMAQLKGLISKSGKRKAESVDSDDEEEEESRAAPRRRTQREETSRRAKGRVSRRRGSSASSQRGGDGESDYEAKSVDPIGELVEYQRLRVGRSNFADFCYYPGFEKYLLGCFTRVCFNVDNVTHENQYRMTQIKAFKIGKPYQLTNKSNHTHMCDQYFVAAYGSNERTYPFIACSDSKFAEAEFLRWKSTMDKDGISQLTSKDIRYQVAKINDMIQRKWTQDEVNLKLENQARHDHLLRSNKNQVVVGTETLRRDEALQRRNEANRRYNQETIRAALIEERRRKKEAALRAAEKVKADQELLLSQELVEPKTQKKIELYHKKDYVKDLTSFSRPKTDDEIIAELDIPIDVEI